MVDILHLRVNPRLRPVGLTSRKIYGNSADQVTVTIRCGTNSPGHLGPVNNIAYRRKPASVQDRDRQRLEEFNVRYAENTGQSHDMDTCNIDNIAKFRPGAPMHGPSSSDSALPQQVDHLCHDLACVTGSSDGMFTQEAEAASQACRLNGYQHGSDFNDDVEN